jgi:chaperonin cofactor prefoldin
MRILGDLTEKTSTGGTANPEKRANPDFASAGANRKESLVGEIPLNTASEPDVRTRTRSGNNGGTGRSHGLEATHKGGEGTHKERPHEHPGGTPWLAITALAVALIAAAGYGYRALEKDNSVLMQVPAIQRMVTTLGTRTDATEAQLRDLTANWGTLANRVTKLDRKVSSGLLTAHKQTVELIAQAEGRLRADMDGRTRVIDARLDRVESNQADDRARLAQMQDQLQKEVAGVREEAAGRQYDTGRDLASLHQQVNQGQSDLRVLNQRIARQRVNFEAVKNSTVELAPGVSLTVLKTDVSYQRFEGYLSLTNDGRTLWLRHAGAQQAVPFYSKQTSRPYDLVVTTVGKDGVVGYLMLPAGGTEG